MERDLGTIISIKYLGYPNNICVKQCRCDELPCPLLTWLVSELRSSCPELQVPRGGAVLVGELKDVLNDVFCPYTALTTEDLNPILLSQVTDFLVSELLAARILNYREEHPEDVKKSVQGAERGIEQRETKGYAGPIDLEENNQECETGENDVGGGKEKIKDELAQLFQTLDLDEASNLCDASAKVKSQLALLPEGEVPEPLLKASLSSSQWEKVRQINRALSRDYECRRQMMMKRFHVTLQSFTWGERGKERSAALSSAPPLLSLESGVSVAHLLAAREDQSRILPVKAGPSTAVHKVQMGSVPDRGGRPGEIEPPMPSWSRRSEGGGSEGRGRGKFKKREFSGQKKKNKNR